MSRKRTEFGSLVEPDLTKLNGSIEADSQRLHVRHPDNRVREGADRRVR